MQLNYELSRTTAYVWDTDTTSLQLQDEMLFAVITMLVILILLVLMAILPKLSAKLDNWDSGGMSTLLAFILIIEIYLHIYFMLSFKYSTPLYTLIRFYLGLAILGITIFGGMCGAIMSCYYGRNICNLKETASFTDNFASAYVFGTCFAVYILPILIKASIYPTEIISCLGFFVIAVISIPTARSVLKSFISISGTDKLAKASKNMKCRYYVEMALLLFCVYIIFPIVVCVLLILYLSFLKVLLESPTSQITQVLLAFLPPICVGFGSYALNKILGNKGDQDKPDPTGKSETDSEDNETNHTSGKARKKHPRNTRANEQTDSLSHDCASTNSRDGGRRSRARPQQDDSSQEMQVLVEVHQDDNSETENSSII